MNNTTTQAGLHGMAGSFQTDIKGLVLAGGSSSRMGRNKGDLTYHDTPQNDHTAALLAALGLDTYISVRKDQPLPRNFPYIVDRYENIGPMAGLLSAFEQHHGAWLVVGCDYPLLKTRHLRRLLLKRDKSKAATVFESGGFLLPTVALYEAAFFPTVQQSLLHKNHSLRKLLRENAIRIIKTRSRAFTSVDTPAARRAVKKELHESIFRNS